MEVDAPPAPAAAPANSVSAELEPLHDAPQINTAGQNPETSAAAKKQKKEKESKGILELKVPVARVKRIMKSDKEVHLVSNEATHLVCKATELFLEQLASESFKRTTHQGRKTLQYKDLATAVHDIDIFEFLTDVLPLTGAPPEVAVEKNKPKPPTTAPATGSAAPAPSSSQRTLNFAPATTGSSNT